ncbi:MAG: 2-oxoglutarate dehydrogenase complex dihydrolipoyllysine-residue succinyltransferase [Bacteroidetes bacterium]|nr:2-oxoglutarate dehydrogenase complex dihydrolipoyllysine-residue succinyltransferase [Bacteroidota bacterium]
MAIEIKVPSPGESISEVTVSKWLKQVGDYVKLDEPLVELESEKATFEVNAEVAGIITKQLAKDGDEIKVGSVIVEIDNTADAPAEAPKAETAKAEIKAATPAAKEAAPKAAEPITKPVTQSIESDVHIAPLAKELMLEHGLKPAEVNGTGPNGRITRTDVLEAIVANGGSKTATNRYSNASGERNTRVEKMTNLRKTVAKRLVAAKNETAMLTTFNEVNMKPIMDLRNKYKTAFLEKHEISLGFMSFFTRACCIALQDWPAVNAFIDGDSIQYNDYCDISIAVSGPRGLVVPVIRSAETLSLADIEKEVKRLALKARDNKLSMEEMSGGTFTITNGGVFGSMMSTPIVNPPQSAILGMHNIIERPIAENGQLVIRPMMYVALSYDHRIIDGKESVSFLVRVKTLLENPEMLFDGKLPTEKVLGL